jgi:tyrosine-protein kinase Etk/Wzc
MEVSAQVDPRLDQPASPLATAHVLVRKTDTPQVLLPSRALVDVRLLWEQRRLVAGVVLAGIALSLVIALLIPNSYEATTEFVGAGDSVPAVSLAIGIPNAELLVSILSSDTVRNQLVNRFDLRRVYGVDTYREARNKLEQRTKLRNDRATGMVRITVRDREPQRASDLARAYVEELNRKVWNLNSSTALNEDVFLEERINVARQELKGSAKQLSQFSSENTVVDVDEQVSASLRSLANLQGEQIAIQSELRELEQIYGAQHIRVRMLRARLAQLRRQTAQMVGAGSGGYSTFSGGVKVLPGLRELPSLSASYADLSRKFQTKAGVLDSLATGRELTKLQEANDIPSVKVIDVAQPPEKSSGPPRFRIVAMGVLLSLFCARLLAWKFPRVHSSQEIELTDLSPQSEASTTLSVTAP